VTRGIPLGLTALLVASCGGAKPEPANLALLQLSSAETTLVQNSVRKTLLDPDTVGFGLMNAGRAADGKVPVCGWVNVKNSGDEPFYGVVTTVDGKPVFNFQLFRGDESSAAEADQICRDAGVVLPARR
jgi:hypothetical protein